MIITKLDGGLGNQLFQYSIGKSLALKNNSILKLDITSYKVNLEREYVLKNSKVQPSIASNKLIDKIYDDNRLINRLLKRNSWHIYRERYNQYIPELEADKSDIYLIGHWQNNRYFSDIKQTLIEELQYNKSYSKRIERYFKLISSTNSVSIHIRRGDYINNSNVSKTLNNLSQDYYISAQKLIASKITKPSYYIFSDDIERVKKSSFLKGDCTYIDRSVDDWESFELMKKCNSSIIANSSFSWWGAWLNNNKKIVIAPQNWYTNSQYKNNNILNEWYTI